jgi:hypothetical protein
LAALRSSVTVALVRTTDRATRLHLGDALDQITRALDPKFFRTLPVTATLVIATPTIEELLNSEYCFSDYAIRIR